MTGDTVAGIKSKIRKRAPLKAKLTKLKNYLDNKIEEIDIDYLKLKLADIERAAKDFEIIQSELEALVSDEIFDNELKERSDFEEMVTQCISKALNKPFLKAFPIYAIVSKLDDQTRLKWKEQTQGSELPKMEELIEFLYSRRKILEIMRPEKLEISQPTNKAQSRSNTRQSTENNKSTFTYSTQTRKPYCHLCKNEHYTQNCQKLLDTSVSERAKVFKKANLCFNCLRANHQIKDCTAHNCKKCNGKHHTLLHREKPVN